MNYHDPEGRGIWDSKFNLQLKGQLLNKKFFIGALIGNVFLNAFGISIFAYRIGIESRNQLVSGTAENFPVRKTQSDGLL